MDYYDRDDRAEPSYGAIKEVVEFLKSNVISGSVDVKKQSEYPSIQYQTDAGEFQLHQVSSMVSEIAPMILYLKYLVKPGHLLIFEEPESHLHPANQSYVARAIAMLVNAGVRVLVTTHSDIFLNQINNLVQIYSLGTKRPELHYTANERLNPNDVAAYLFQPSDCGTQVARLPSDADYGIRLNHSTRCTELSMTRPSRWSTAGNAGVRTASGASLHP